CASLHTLSPSQRHRLHTYLLGLVIVLWAFTSILVTAFQCALPQPWAHRPSGCIDQNSFLTYVATLNVLTDIGLILLPARIIYPLNMAFMTRAIVISFCLSRLLAIAATITQLAYLPGLSEVDYTFASFPYYLSAQIAQFASFFSACAVYIWPFLRSLRSGLMWVDNTTVQATYALTSTPRSGNNDRSAYRITPGGISSQRRSDNYIKITTDISLSNEPSGGKRTRVDSWNQPGQTPRNRSS
ncbi:hypothetical protein F5Y17DRAFT_475261, partial [Xylariaceae sp. FL0594]